MEYYKKSIFKKFPQQFSKQTGMKIPIATFEKSFHKIMKQQAPIEDKMAAIQFHQNIVPAISTYRVLRSRGYSKEDSYNYIKEYVFDYYKIPATCIGVFGKLPFFYKIFKAIFPLAMKMYPEKYWKVEWIKQDNHEIAFNMTDCLYYRAFQDYKCPQLTSIFCALDHMNYDNMSKEVQFIRTQTLGNQGDKCDFRFVHTK